MARDDILRSYEAKQSVCARNWTCFTSLLPVIQSLGQTVRSDVWFRNESFFWTGSFSWTSWTRFTESSETVHGSDLLVTRTNSLLDASDSHSDSVSDPVMNELMQSSSSSNRHWTEQTVRLEPKTGELLTGAHWPSGARCTMWASPLHKYVTLDHKTSLKSHRYICSYSQKYIVWVKIIYFSFIPKIIRTLSKYHVPWRYFVHFLL